MRTIIISAFITTILAASAQATDFGNPLTPEKVAKLDKQAENIVDNVEKTRKAAKSLTSQEEIPQQSTNTEDKK